MPTLSDSVTETAGAPTRHGLRLVGIGLWTILVVVALWWLFRESADAGPSAWVVQSGDPSHLTFWQRARDWFRLMHVNFQRIYPWILFGPYVVWLTSYFHLERGKLALHLPVQVAGCVLFALASYAVNSRLATTTARVVVVTGHQQTTTSIPGPGQESKAVHVEFSSSGSGEIVHGQDFLTTFREGTITGSVARARAEAMKFMPTNLLPELAEAFKPGGPRRVGLTARPLSTLLDLTAYGALAGLTHAVYFYRRYHERERRARVLESHLARARLSALQAQLQPHFLFNALNAIATLLRRDPRAAEATLLSLSELLRLSLSRSEEQEIALREELKFLDRYLEIQRTRFGDRLQFEHQVEPAALDCLVPTLILQPLVENAIRHGIEPSPSPGLVRVTAQHRQERLALSVEDDGVGLDGAPGPSERNGIGLSNLRERLETLFGPNHHLEIGPRSGGGTVVHIEIPWRAVAPDVNRGNGAS